ncbi:hypothetical protein C8E96_1639 [Actinokineospora alba]|nr:hypothetical protein C8E96_1639 [Actinokineospora alba]
MGDGPACAGFLVQVAAGPRHTIVLHPEDFLVPRSRIGDRSYGCCGPGGSDGPKLRCECGAEIATEINDCYTPHEIRLEPALVVSVSA